LALLRRGGRASHGKPRATLASCIGKFQLSVIDTCTKDGTSSVAKDRLTVKRDIRSGSFIQCWHPADKVERVRLVELERPAVEKVIGEGSRHLIQRHIRGGYLRGGGKLDDVEDGRVHILM
jgi:hypothetical protein